MRFKISALPTAVRVNVLVVIVGVIGGILAGALFLAGLFSRHHGFFNAGEVALVASMLSFATTRSWQTYMFYRAKTWTMLDARVATRPKQPRRFAIWLTSHGVLASVWWLVAVFLIWSLWFSNRSGS
jgi:hypothetical protein